MSLGSIIVRLTMNTADFETDAGRAAKVAEKRAKEIDAAFRKAGVAIGAALGTAIVGAVAAVKSAIDHMDEMAKASARVGQSTEEFSKLVYAGSLADVEMSTLVSTMGKLTKAQAAALDSGSKQAKMFDALGISVKNADGSLRSSNDVLMDFADRFKALGGSQEAIAAGFEIFGRSFQDIIPLIKDGADGLRAAGDEAERLGVVVDSEAAAAAEKFNDNLTRLKTAVSGVAMEIAEGMLPELTKLTDEMVGAAGQSNTFGEIGAWLGGQVRAAANDMKFMVDTLKDIHYWASNVADGMVNLNAALNKASNWDFDGARKAYEAARRNSDAAYNAAMGRRPDFSGVTDGSEVWARVTGTSYGAPSNPRALRSVFSGGGAKPKSGGRGGGRKGGGGGISRELQEQKRAAEEAQREMERVAAAQDRWNASILDLEASLAGPLAEAQREYDKNMRALNDAFAKGEVTLADYAKGEEAYAAALKRSKDEISARLSPADQMLFDIEEEIKLLRMSTLEQEKYIAAKRAGVALDSEKGRAIASRVEELADLRELRSLADGLTASFEDMFSSFLDGSKSASEAWADFMDDITKQIMRFLVSQALKKLMEALSQIGGQQQGGATGGNFWGQLLGAIFGGGRASGGPVSGSRLYEVGEGGKPELFQQGGKTYLIPGNDGNVVPATSGVSAPSGGMQVIINNNAGAKVSARQEQGKGPDGSMLRRMVIDIVADSMNGGQLGVVTRNRFGLREAV